MSAPNPVTWGFPASTWDVIGTLLTGGGLLFAGLAAVVAVLQHRATGRARLEQARPYVILSAVESPVDRSFIDLQLANVGNGPAYEVTIKVTPPFVTATDEAGHELRNARIFNEPTPMLPPHYSVTMFFDSVFVRFDKEDLPDRFEARISYRDASGHKWEDELNIVDVGMQKGLVYTEVFGIHHAAKALREIQKDTKTLAAKAGVVDATVESREDREARAAVARDERRRRVALWKQREREQEASGEQTEASSE